MRKSKYAAISSSREVNQTTPTAAASTNSPSIIHDEFRLHATVARVYRLMESQMRHGRLTASKPVTSEQLASLYPHYDCFDQSLPALERFTHVRNQTHCIFARKSRVAGSPALTTGGADAGGASPSVTSQTLAAVPGFTDFTLRVKASYPILKDQSDDRSALPSPNLSLSPEDPSSFYTADTRNLLEWPMKLADFQLDAFVLEISGGHGRTLASFAAAVKEALKTLSRCDPVVATDSTSGTEADEPGDSLDGLDLTSAQALAALDSASADQVLSSSRWHFSFLRETFFVTCFAPCYRKNHARYMFTEEMGDQSAEAQETFSDKCYLLFQPELSFLRHNLSADTKDTNWLAPKTERDRIRIAFKQHDRAYPIPPTVAYPTAEFIVPPIEPFSGQIVRWWQQQPQQQ